MLSWVQRDKVTSHRVNDSKNERNFTNVHAFSSTEGSVVKGNSVQLDDVQIYERVKQVLTAGHRIGSVIPSHERGRRQGVS